ncbi:MAG TPA: type II toxin-antitoxin system RelE/ParE family toxin [Thermoanaerobaculia bacterium]|nr:type II toxin-antitoxin system RelE/ParE family toxin [Thermoanaerobaculia bacterium]
MSSELEVLWIDLALRDLQQIFEYVAAEAPTAARKLFGRITEHSRALEKFPLRGRVVPELARYEVKSFRELIIPPYRLIYLVDQDRVIIYGVFDGRRNLEDVILSRVSLPLH